MRQQRGLGYETLIALLHRRQGVRCAQRQSVMTTTNQEPETPPPSNLPPFPSCRPSQEGAPALHCRFLTSAPQPHTPGFPDRPRYKKDKTRRTHRMQRACVSECCSLETWCHVHTRRRSRRLYAASAERRRAWNRAATPPGHVFFIVVQALRSIPLSISFTEVTYSELRTSGIYSSGEPQHKRSTPCRLVQLNPYTDVFEQAAHIPRPKRNANHNNRKEKKRKKKRACTEYVSARSKETETSAYVGWFSGLIYSKRGSTPSLRRTFLSYLGTENTTKALHTTYIFNGIVSMVYTSARERSMQTPNKRTFLPRVALEKTTTKKMDLGPPGKNTTHTSCA